MKIVRRHQGSAFAALGRFIDYDRHDKGDCAFPVLFSFLFFLPSRHGGKGLVFFFALSTRREKVSSLSPSRPGGTRSSFRSLNKEGKALFFHPLDNEGKALFSPSQQGGKWEGRLQLIRIALVGEAQAKRELLGGCQDTAACFAFSLFCIVAFAMRSDWLPIHRTRPGRARDKGSCRSREGFSSYWFSRFLFSLFTFSADVRYQIPSTGETVLLHMDYAIALPFCFFFLCQLDFPPVALSGRVLLPL